MISKNLLLALRTSPPAPNCEICPSYLISCSVTVPFKISTACGKAGTIISRHSRTALGLPGILIINVFFLTPATARLNIAIGVLPNVPARTASGIPGTSFSITARVASGVTSRAARPGAAGSQNYIHTTPITPLC